MRQQLFLSLALLSFSAPLAAGSFDVSAAVDRNEVELGEALRYTLSLTVKGRMDFPVQVDTPQFDGFQAQGPGRQDSSSWINGAVTEQHVFTWDLVPIKAGKLSIPALKVNAKDAVNGDVTKLSPAISIQVRRPKNAYAMGGPGTQPLPAYATNAQAQPTPAPDDGGLRDIKADRGLPWARLAALFGAFGAVLALLGWWARRPSQEPSLPQVRDPRALAFRQLDAALQRLSAGDQQGFIVGAGQALRGYLRQRLDLRHEATLSEAMGACIRNLPDKADKEQALALRFRLEHLLYGDAGFKDSDKALLDQESRHLINSLERLAGR